ncbi:hypothetical protein [Pectobacterium carotovorum]|uniref:hypothetical protein n=1 Tax=Pectobacterium carotovorum TaxID=554 RepID=UPI0004FF9B13|nr:hypothetical protein [Pectobacterium carotovorum]KFW97576.1 hypothetical protein JV33_21475 [Pectobacterium carotovorum subsp. carotovorum]KML64954.1 hypothetical protein G032_21045 [Pectobacterium carotovorum subsp. carotovorum ICMP 5702]SHH68483.1 hypothetical protein SAMN05444147_11623 [Pectobacterium carotovorum]
MATEIHYSYNLITAATEKKLNEYIASAVKEPEKTETFRKHFVATFWLWFEVTRDDPLQNNDGPRFMELQLAFPDVAQELAAFDAAD